MPQHPEALDNRLQRELWALALLLLATLLALSFVPPVLFGETGARLFPTGNIVGGIGALVSRAAWDLLGVGAFAIPALPLLWAAVVHERLPRSLHLRMTGLLAGLLLLVPAAVHTFSRPLFREPAAAGWAGRALGNFLAAGLGWLGASLLLSFLLVATCILTLGWNPLRSLLSGVRAGWGGARQARSGLRLAAPGWPRPGRARVSRRPGVGPAREPLLEEASFGAAGAEPEPPLVEPLTPDPPPPAGRPASLRGSGARAVRKVAALVLPDAGDPTSGDLPTTSLLDSPPRRDEARSRRHLDGQGKVLIEKLATFKIEGVIVGTTAGPVVTQYEISPAPGVKVARIANLEADLALAMKAPSVRIVAPIPGKGAVGVEVPNPEPEMVYFRDVLESPAFRDTRAELPLVLGKDIAGRPYVADLGRMPHLLIAGATGSGKSVCINTIITSLVFRHSPRSLRLLMIDPKMVELSVYNDLPHLRHPVVTDNSEAAGVLKWAVLEMETRYALLSANNVRNLHDFNRRVEEGQVIRSPEAEGEEGDPDRWIYKRGPLPFVVVIIDELADLMMTVQGEVERPLALLAQKARAIGIHLILATQRPSVNVLTGLIKANFPSRIAFRVASKVDSRTILDQNGADSLLGNGDMLFLPPGRSDPLRIQGAYLSTEETERLMSWYREQASARGDEALAAAAAERDILDLVRAKEAAGDDFDSADDSLDDVDRLFRDAAELCIQHQGGSTSLLQRRLRIGYGRAARIVDQLHQAGILGPADGSKSREVLVDFAKLDQIFPGK